MLQTVAKKSARFTTRASLLLALMVVGAAQRVEAGCGHLVTSNAARESLEALTSLGVIDVDASELEVKDWRIPLGQRPCNGPSCSRKEGVPTAPILINLVIFDRWCVLREASLTQMSCVSRLFFLSNRIKPRHLSSSIERPPRSAS